MKDFVIGALITFILVIILSVFSYAAKASMVVTDPGTYSYLTGIDKKQQEQLQFLQSIQDSTLEIKSNINGNKRIGYGINNTQNFYNDWFSLPGSSQPNQTPINIIKNLDLTFLPVKIKVDNDFHRKNYQQNAAKLSMILSEMVISSAKQRSSEITALANEIDGATKLKESIDVNNRILLEILLETRNTNLLLATTIKANLAKDFVGSLTPDNSDSGKDKVKDFYEGKDDLSHSIKRSSGSGRFSTLTR